MILPTKMTIKPEFVKFVAENYDRTNVKQGNSRSDGSETYLIQIVDEHANTLFIELSRDGSYWNVNSGGVFRANYGENKRNVQSASEVQNGESAPDNTLQPTANADNNVDSNGTVSDVSNSKDNTTFSEKQAAEAKTSQENISPEAQLATEATIKALTDSGIDVVQATDEMAMAVLGNSAEMMAKKRRALETASVQEEHQPTVVSSADAAKVLNNLDNVATEYEEKSNQPKTFLGDVAKALGAERKGSGSQYVTFETKNGKVVTIRLSNHNATVSNFDNNGEADGISIVVSAKGNAGITNDGDAHIVEYYYDAIKLRRAEGKPLADIVRSIKQALYSGEFKDTTGLAERQEVNLNEIEAQIIPNNPIFYSNAEHAVRNIKQEKATPQQWLAMIQKNGGLKAGEDKWLGLSDWLKNNEAKTLTKQEVLDFIAQNQIKIEEVRYSQFGAEFINEATKKLEAELKEVGWDEMEERYPGFGEYFEMYGNELVWSEESASIGEYEDFILDNRILNPNVNDNAINETRERYTTEGLENKKEIALVVPSIESYNISDETHFGDAGVGRAVAWARFGETTDENGNRVLVIDEIQSKRHQDGREKGYRGANDNVNRRVMQARGAVSLAEQAFATFREEMKEKYGYAEAVQGSAEERKEGRRNWKLMFTTEELAKYDQLHDATIDARNALEEARQAQSKVPDAPFEKNWHELAMKRMLRYAAENGFDKVAWTTGAQQAERYDIGSVVEAIRKGRENDIIVIDLKNGEYIPLVVDKNGLVISGRYQGEKLSNIIGKELAEKAMDLPIGESLTDVDLHIGGEGMKGFYDKMLPSFMNKYGKKWGVKVGEATMPGLQEGYQTMHSIDVTDAMKESVMEGQPMFLRTPQGTVYGWTDGKRIYLTKEGMNPETPIHEYTHLWARAMMQNNAEGWQSIKDLLRDTPIWQEVVNDTNYANIRGNEDAIASEALSRLSGRQGAKKMQEMARRLINEGNPNAQSLIDRMRHALQEFWNWVGTNLFGIKSFDSIDQVTDRVLWDMLNGTDLGSLTASQAEQTESSADEDVAFSTSTEIDELYPNWLEGTTTDSGKHSTQVEGTRKTYGKVGTWIEENLGKDVAILDASSGMGYGTADLRERGFNIEDVEPYQSEERKQNNPATYSSYADIRKQYDYIISNAVLNVIPDDWRSNVLHDMANRLKTGGRMFINTRKAGEEKSIKDKIELDSPQEVLVKRNGRIASYQRFFTPQELKSWVEEELGEGYSVEIANEKNSGTKGLAAVVVTKSDDIAFSISEEEQAIIDRAKADGTYLKAPNGKPTKLTPKQWVQVRTQAFKEWFGDWELVANIKSGLNALLRLAEGEESIPNAMRRDELRTLGGTSEITFDWGTYGKLDKSGTPRGGFGFAKIIQKHGYDEAFRIVETIAKGKIGTPYGVEGGTRVDIVSGDYQTTISLYRNGKSESWVLTGYKIDYNTDAKGRGNDLSKATQTYPTPTREDLGAALKSNANIQYFNDITNISSKVVDENGEPKVVYHQTNSTIYRNVETGENWDDLDWREKQEWEERDDWDDYWQEEDFYTFNRNNARTTVEFDGFFFAPEYDEYHGYGKRTIEAFLNIRKPASQEDYNIDSQYNDAGRKERIRLQENGYDGVIRTEGNEVWEYVAFEPNQIKSATDNIGTFDVNEDDISFSIIGEQGASALDRADEVTHRMDNLNIAREMETTGKDAKAIRLATGWERGADGKWRYEIEDFSIKEEKIDFITNQLDYKNTTAIMLIDLLDDAQGLFVAYPELRNMRVVIKKDSSVIGQGELQWYDAVYDRQIVLNEAAIISHFAKSALDRYAKADVGIIRIKQGYDPTTKEKFTNEAEKQEALDIYIEMMNEALLDYKRFKSRNKDIATRILTHEIQHAIQFIEGFAIGSSPERFADVRGAVLSSISFMTNGGLLNGSEISDSQSLRDALSKKIPYTNVSLKEGYADNLQKVARKYGYDNIDALVDDFENMPSAFEQYHRTAGEVESRNVQKRMDMSDEQRRETLLADTEDVARKDQIFLMENSGISAMGTTVTRRKADIAVKLQGRDVSPTQLKVLDAFTTNANNITIDVVDANGKQRSITLKQGQDNRAGVKHSVLRHYETASNSYTAEEILLIPQIIEQGERKQDGKKVSYKLDIGGVKYTVTTEIRNGIEEFTNYYTNRKPINESLLNTDEQHGTTSQSVSANEGSDNISPLQENGELFKRGDIYDYKTGDKITMQNVNVALYREHGPYGQALKQNVSFRGVVLGWGKAYQIDVERLNENLDKALIILEEYKEHLTSLKSNATTPAQKVIDEQIAKIDASMDWANQTKENPSLFHERWHNAPFLELLRPMTEEVINAEFPDNPSVVAQQTAEALGVDIEIDDTLPAKGSYNTRTGRIRINPHRHSSPQDIERTILHEVIGHGGLQALSKHRMPHSKEVLTKKTAQKIAQYNF